MTLTDAAILLVAAHLILCLASATTLLVHVLFRWWGDG